MMTDPLAERFLATADDTYDADWFDVRRRTRRRRPIVLIVFIAAAILAAAAVASTSGWQFGVQYGHATGEASVLMDGTKYTVWVQQTGGDGRFFLMRLYDTPSRDPNDALTTIAGSTLLHTPGLPDNPLIPRQYPHGPAAFGMQWAVGDGEIWFGDARPEVARIVITDTHGNTFATDTVAAPKYVKSAFRYWTLALPSTYAKTITAYTGDGTVIDQRPLYPSRRQTLY